jgi:hypothetical protein
MCIHHQETNLKTLTKIVLVLPVWERDYAVSLKILIANTNEPTWPYPCPILTHPRKDHPQAAQNAELAKAESYGILMPWKQSLAKKDILVTSNESNGRKEPQTLICLHFRKLCVRRFWWWELSLQLIFFFFPFLNRVFFWVSAAKKF